MYSTSNFSIIHVPCVGVTAIETEKEIVTGIGIETERADPGETEKDVVMAQKDRKMS